MGKRRIYWQYGNPQFDAWTMETDSGQLVIRRNHALIKSRNSNCEGWDVWQGERFLGAIGSCSLRELSELSSAQLKKLLLPACCGKHRDFAVERVKHSSAGWGGRRANAGRRCKAEVRRVNLATTVDRRTLEWIDRNRGSASRGEFIDQLVADKQTPAGLRSD